MNLKCSQCGKYGNHNGICKECFEKILVRNGEKEGDGRLDIDKVITQLMEAAVSCNRMAEEYGEGDLADLETLGFYKGKSEAFQGAALLLAELQLEDTLANLK
ncbi:hypothetical protein P9Z59_13560 [Bacillus thuringiensis]|uniref:Uncharacterized protein n=1 Tax=Bacillus thuringiensis subsp. tolworthi TaxID=1442 RepID=A0A9W4A138_BACTO|nr:MULTISPECIES: hypothetical protein [Bacillus cereus group]KAB1367985.1 hypothetical protein FPG89_25165 [Bacillus thuringiensis]KIP26868.1 hypothetical protein BG10_4142 [Bacillus thuringiensis serovar morrisoni]MCT6947818.1 hypothetical protein [Bacillus thuringiensis]MDA2130878.1 hypothetical protein [Bacillus cereus]MDA2524983.1 hypothetical protein [Bacillus cereus]